MTAEQIIEIIVNDYQSCHGVSVSKDKMLCEFWWKHDDCERLRKLLFAITGDKLYSRQQ